jgi:MoaD family protein
MQTPNRCGNDGLSPPATAPGPGHGAGVRVRIPAALREFTDGAAEIVVEAATVADVMQVLGTRSPALRQRILSSDGELRPYVRVYVGDRDARGLDGLQTRLDDGEVVSIIPAVAGG